MTYVSGLAVIGQSGWLAKKEALFLAVIGQSRRLAKKRAIFLAVIG